METRKTDPVYALRRAIQRCMNSRVRTQQRRFLQTHESLDDGYDGPETLARVKEMLKDNIRSNHLPDILENAISEHLPNDRKEAKRFFIDFLDNQIYDPNKRKKLPYPREKRKANTPVKGAPAAKRQSSGEEPTGPRNRTGDLAPAPRVISEFQDFFELPSTPPQTSGELSRVFESHPFTPSRPRQQIALNLDRTPQLDVQSPPRVLEPSFTPDIPSVYKSPSIPTTGFDGVTLAPIQVLPDEPDFNPENRSAIAPVRQTQASSLSERLSFFAKDTSVYEDTSPAEPSNKGIVKPFSKS